MGTLTKEITGVAAGLLLAVAVTGCSTTAPPPGAGQEQAQPGEIVGQKTIWSDADRGWVKLVAAERRGGGYDQPVHVDPQWLRQALYDIKLRVERGDDNGRAIRLFQGAQLDVLVPSLVRGLAEAGPEQAVAFATAYRRGGFTFFDPVRLTTARVFVEGDSLNVLFGTVAEPLPEGEVREFVADARVGTRAEVINEDDTVWSRAWESHMERDDWVVLPVKTAEGELPALPEAGPQPGADPAQRPAPTAADAPAAPSRTARERLKLLKSLHDDGLITDEEYGRKRREVLETL